MLIFCNDCLHNIMFDLNFLGTFPVGSFSFIIQRRWISWKLAWTDFVRNSLQIIHKSSEFFWSRHYRKQTEYGYFWAITRNICILPIFTIFLPEEIKKFVYFCDPWLYNITFWLYHFYLVVLFFSLAAFLFIFSWNIKKCIKHKHTNQIK